MVYSGIDLHRRFCFITTVNEDGKVLSQVKIRNDELAILAYFSSFNQPHKAVVECTMVLVGRSAQQPRLEVHPKIWTEIRLINATSPQTRQG